LTRRPLRGHEQLHPEHAHVVERVAIRAAVNTASLRCEGLRRAGTVVLRRMPSAWTFSPGS
jgi:hypothetical protein